MCEYRIQTAVAVDVGAGNCCLVGAVKGREDARPGAEKPVETNQGVKMLMRAKLFLLIVLFTFPVIAAPQKKKDFIGYRHKGVLYGQTLPNGARDLGGGLLSDGDYGVSRFVKGKKYMLWLEKITHRDAKGVPSWVVKDVLVFDDVRPKHEFLFSYSSGCTQNGVEDLDLVVMTEFLPARKAYKVLKAWRADVVREKFEKVSTRGIVCRYEHS